MYNISDIQSIAAALYDGGWRAEDKEQIIAEIEYNDKEKPGIYSPVFYCAADPGGAFYRLIYLLT